MRSVSPKVEQSPIQEVTKTIWDVIVIGAGPAGSIAAAYLAGKGHQTLLLDKETFPRNKICGDGLNHDSLRFLKKIGLFERVHSAGLRVETASIFSASGLRLVVPGPYLCLERRIFDAVLAERAVRAGTTFCSGEVQQCLLANNRLREIRIAGDDRPFCARYVLLTTGASMKLARSVGIGGDPFPSAVAARCYVRSKERIDTLTGSFVRSVLPGYGWVFPLGDDLFNMGVIAYYTNGRNTGSALKRRFRRFTEDFAPARRVLERGRFLTGLRAAPLRCGLPSGIVPGRGNILAAGETIGATLPFTGEGIGKAMETGELAAETIHRALADDSQDPVRLFSSELDKTFRPKYMGYHTAERWVGHPWINDFMARRGRKSKYLQKAMIDAIPRGTDPGRAFSLGGIIRSFWT